MQADRRRPLALLVLVTIVVAGLSVGVAPSSFAGDDRDRWPMTRETNHSRVTHDLRKVDLRAAMSELARRHSVRMARNGELFHTVNPASYYLRGIRWSVWGENVGYTTGDVDGLQRMFMNSPSHRANILNRRFRHVAVGTVRRDGTLWVTVFFYG